MALVRGRRMMSGQVPAINGLSPLTIVAFVPMMAAVLPVNLLAPRLAKRPGDPHPNVEGFTCDPTLFQGVSLPDHTARRRKLSELQGQHPMVLVLSRGGFCPKDRRQAEGLVALHRELEVGYCRLVTISTDNITETNEYRSGVGAHWPFLSDVRRIVQKDLDIAEYTDPHHNPMIPHVIVLEPGLIIYKIYNGYWFFGRPTLEELRQDLRTVLQKCRPDWDITKPELKAAWEQGRKELFYPYGKTYVQTLGEQD
jgi:peroxiredoxin